jgi:uncharacterized membrane protein YkvA (DUF1232 family)
MLERWKQWARHIKRDTRALYSAARDPRVPWFVKALAIAVAAYALSPIDLIPDFVPVLGYLDDLIIVPLGIALVVWLMPPDLMTHHRALVEAQAETPVSRGAAIVIVGIWIVTSIVAGWACYRWLAD